MIAECASHLGDIHAAKKDVRMIRWKASVSANPENLLVFVLSFVELFSRTQNAAQIVAVGKDIAL